MKRHVPLEGREGIYWSETKAGKVYECRYMDSEGKRHYKVTGKNLQDALTFQAKIKVRHGKNQPVIASRRKFSEVALEWEAMRLSEGTRLTPNTVSSYKSYLKNHIMPEFQNRQVKKISGDMIHLWLRDIPCAESSKLVILSILSDILSFAANPRRGYIEKNPCIDLERGERPRAEEFPVRILTSEESDKLLECSQEWLKPILKTALLSGLRAGEILGLRWEDVDFNQGELTVRHQIQGGKLTVTKGKKPRTVDIFPQLRTVLFGLPTRFEGGYVFQGKPGVPMNYNRVNVAFRRARTKAALSTSPREVRFHDLRHTFASILLRDGKDVVWVSRILGHANPALTMRVYAHVINRQDRKEEAAMRLAESLGGWAQ